MQKKTPRNRQLDISEAGQKKHGREESPDSGLEGGARRSKRPKAGSGGRPREEDFEEGSDEDGNRWRLGGMQEDDEDSEIDSDDAFGASDEEKFQDFTFGGSKEKVRFLGPV